MGEALRGIAGGGSACRLLREGRGRRQNDTQSTDRVTERASSFKEEILVISLKRQVSASEVGTCRIEGLVKSR